MSGLFLGLGFGSCFLMDVVRETLPDLLLPVSLITSDVELEPKCQGTLCESYWSDSAANGCYCNWACSKSSFCLKPLLYGSDGQYNTKWPNSLLYVLKPLIRCIKSHYLPISFPGSLFFPPLTAPGEEKKRDPGNEVDSLQSCTLELFVDMYNHLLSTTLCF